VYGWVEAGELIGVGVAYAVMGNLGALLSWRVAFWLLAAAGVVAVPQIWRLPEPGRGGRGTLPVEARPRRPRPEGASIHQAVVAARVSPSPEAVLNRDPSRMHLPDAVRAILRVRTNVALIVASALGYFFFAGLQTFALVFVEDRYQVGAPLATFLALIVGLGAMTGVLAGGRLADVLIGRGVLPARVLVGGTGYLLAVGLLFPALLVRSLTVALPLLFFAALALAAVNPPMDAARLDIMHHRLWGRAEAVRSVLRTAGQAVAPLLFGVLSDVIAGGSATGLQITFILMLIPLAASGVVVLRTRTTYLRDIAAVAASGSPDDSSGRSTEEG
jgi:predicted MFS family arabinose efflux permease